MAAKKRKPLEINVEVLNLNQAKRSMQKLYPDGGKAWRRSMIIAGSLVKREAQKKTPVDTGDLKRSARNITQGQGWHAFAKIYYTMDYSAIVHETHKSKSKFLESAYRENKQKIVSTTMQLLKAGFNKGLKP